ncbi:hypothetical protein [Brevundimonas sp.]|uniref:hypothetical protein n=1 Tax=Brevundimonas sp. TaxID=1871086 RepID=UPI002633EAA7|nr:hypothetical protein [Brevundimonas sp.]
MARPTFRDSFVRALEAAGGRASNTALRATLDWPEDRYWKIHSELFDDAVIEKGRGYGGTVILATNQAEEVAPQAVVETTTVVATAVTETAIAYARELDLYEPARKAIDTHWAQRRQLDNSHCEITAMQGRRETGGSWTRPDLIVIGSRKYEFLPQKIFELVSFEVKPASDVSIKGVMEALAHREAATRSYVLYHTDGEEFSTFPEYTRITDLAAKHGIGVYSARDIADFDQWAEVVPAQLANPDPEVVDTFLRRTLSDEGKTKLRKWF